MNNTLEDYEKLDPLPSSIESPIVNIDGFAVECSGCSQPTVANRGEIRQAAFCVEIRACGICMECDQLNWSRIRFYDDRYMLFLEDGNYVTNFYSTPSLFVKIIDKIKNFFV